MTPFMLRVAELVESEDLDVPLPVPATVPSQRRSLIGGAEYQVGIRALAEQLVCEANAVLGDDGDQMSLTDEVVDDQLVFTVGYRGRAARVATRFSDGRAEARLVADGIPADEPRELAGTEALPDLLILLLAESDVPHHHVGW
ncbi:MAG: hypothetical protein MUC45_06815 [Actinomycetia bacterium]|jgi:hypothetical protein|nr:hypothetical protein [Actinomycetes bacterium]